MNTIPTFRVAAGVALGVALAGCVSYDRSAADAVNAMASGNDAVALKWSVDLADESASSRLGTVETGRIHLLGGNFAAAETDFRKAIDSAIDRKEKEPVIKLGDTARTVLASTVSDDRSIEYYLSPYEINLALEYGILAQAFNGHGEDALVDARLSCYVQDKLAAEYGADINKQADGKDGNAKAEVDRIVSEQNEALQAMIASTRNSWENPVLWWLTGVFFEADGDIESAWQSYRRAGAIVESNPFFQADVRRADSGKVTPAAGKAKLVVLIDDGFVPRFAALKIPLRIYATMSIDIPMYQDKAAYSPKSVTIAGSKGETTAAMGVDVRSLAARDLCDSMVGIVTRNVTRAAVNVGVQAAGRASGNDWVRVAAELTNLLLVLAHSADTRSWVTLPDAQYVWCDPDMAPGDYELGVNIAGKPFTVRVRLAAGATKLVYLADLGGTIRQHQVDLSSK